MKNKKIKVELTLETLVPITEDHGGYESGECLLCDASGWLVEHRFGHPYGTKGVNADLVHKKNCPINKELNLKGTKMQNTVKSILESANVYTLDLELRLLRHMFNDSPKPKIDPTCKTCNDSGRVPTFDQTSQTADADPCPDCQ